MSATPERKSSTRIGIGGGGGGADMRAVGMSLGEMNQRNLAERRHKKGECPTCGNKTHKIGLFGKRTALTIEGSCLYGRCLLCYPVEGYARRPAPAEAALGSGAVLPNHAAGMGGIANVHHAAVLASNTNPHHVHPAMVVPAAAAGAGIMNDGATGVPSLPQNFVIETEDRIPDDATMVSGITMDHRLIVGARNWNGEVEDDEMYNGGDDDDEDNSLVNGFGRPLQPGSRPEPSVGGMDELVMKPPDRTRRPSRTEDQLLAGGGGPPGGGGGGDGRPYGPPKRYASKHEAMMDQVGMDLVRADERSTGGRSGGGRRSKTRPGRPPQTPAQVDDTDSKHVRRNSRHTSPTNSTPGNTNNIVSSNNNSNVNMGNVNNNSNVMSSSDGRRFSGKSNQDEVRFAAGSSAPRYANEIDDVYRGEEKHEVDDFADRPPWENATPPEYALNRQPNDHLLSPGGNAGLHGSNGGTAGISPRGGTSPRGGSGISPRGSSGSGTSPRGGSGSATGYNNNNRRKLGSEDVAMASAGGPDRDLRAMDRGQQFRRHQPSEDVAPAAAAAVPLERARTSGGVARLSNRSIWSTHQKDDSGIGIASGPPPLVDRSRRGLPDDDFTESLGRGGRPQANVRKPSDAQQTSVTIDDIPEIIVTLDHTNRVRGFQSLAELIMANGQMAKMHIRESDGVQILVESMWTDMTDAAVMEAACELLFALTASSDGNPDSDILVGDSAEGAVDALLITMQTHITVESIQSSGCGTLHCLASASSTNPYVPDGTLSGAVFTVVNAMDMHSKSQEVQEWGIRALYSQCMLSTHAESNKKNLAQSGMDGGGGMGVIQQAMETARTDLVTIELACRLYWSLAANEDVARRLMETHGAVNAIVDAVLRNFKKPEAAPVMESAFGALANLARVCENQHLFRDSELIPKAVTVIQAFHYDESLYIEACGLFGVLATDPRNFEVLTSLDVVNIISKLLQHYTHNAILQEEALWALVCLTNGSESGKLALSAEATIGSLVRIMRDRNASLTIQEIACTLIGSLCVLKESTQVAVTNGAIDAALALLKSYPTERRIHEAVFVTLRNITSHGTGVDMFLKFPTSKTILDAMSASTDSVTAQLNACCMLWNICAKAKKDPSSLVDAGAIMQVVKAMQTHMESGEVLEMACGALWCLIDQSDSRKKELLGCGAIDAVTCSLVMHPKEPPTLEKACGLLANVCTQTFMAEAIADSQGISMVVEAMRNNSSSMKLLELGTLVLRNMVLTNHEFAMEASNGISAVINCMKENPDAVGFQREACNALWALAAQSEECKNKILALDGVTVLMGALEHNSCVGDVQDAARGAINQLALSGPM